ncbi:hypothetical protein GYMLUDRAFT_240974 [Collybiopsis luxurians FD-317 M1]|nr:hypothetical protein GYMLUDRAFT_240974 [Collybiopsis luxurians FD-317 M1]
MEEWELRDRCLTGIIYQNIRDPQLIGVTELMSSNIMWRKLTGKFETNFAAAQALAKEHIQQFKYATNEVGCSIQDEDLCTRFLTSLTPNYLWILQTHSAHSYTNLKCTLLEYDMMVQSANAIAPGTIVPSALAVLNRIICKNCNHNGHTKKGCWVQGGGCEGLGPHWYKAPKGMEPIKTANALAAAVTTENPPATTTAATIYQFNNTDFDNWEGKLIPF